MRSLRLLLIVILGAIGLFTTAFADEFKAREMFFLGPANVSYGSLHFRHNVNAKWSVSLNATLSRKSDFLTNGFLIHHGGNDTEILATYEDMDNPNGLEPEYSVGIAKSDTAARGTYNLTARASFNLWKTGNFSTRFGANAVLSGGAVMMPFVEGKYQDGHSAEFSAWLGYCAVGENTIESEFGRNARSWVYLAGVSIPISQDRNTMLSFYVGNQLGMTTGMSISPSLSNKAGFGLAISAKF